MTSADGRPPQRLTVLVAGPYRSGTGDDPEKMASNLRLMDTYALRVLVAGYVPARRAARIDPRECLRTE